MDKNKKLKNQTIRTYTEDMVKAIESDRSGLIKKIIHEEEQHEEEKKNLSPKSRKNRLFMFIGISFICLAFAALIFLVFFNKEASTVLVTPQSSTSIIFIDKTTFNMVDGLSKDKIIDTVVNRVNKTRVVFGGIEGIYLIENQKVLGFNDFIMRIKGSLVSDQIDLISNNFLLGAINSGKEADSLAKHDFFMLLKVRSFADIFPVMLSWENKMLYDLYRFIGMNITPENNYLFTKNFEDGIVENKNARILRDTDGNIVLMYVFINNTSIIITNSELATREVIARLSSSQIKK